MLRSVQIRMGILDTEVLRKARAKPEIHPNLQVRLCKWEALFASPADKEKDKLTTRADFRGKSALVI